MQHEFSHEIVRDAYELGGHRCGCTDASCGHHGDDEGRCGQFLRWIAQGEESPDGWQARHMESTGPGNISNCQILCAACANHAAAVAAAAAASHAVLPDPVVPLRIRRPMLTRPRTAAAASAR